MVTAYSGSMRMMGKLAVYLISIGISPVFHSYLEPVPFKENAIEIGFLC